MAVDTYFVESDVILDVGSLVLGVRIIPGPCVRTRHGRRGGDSPCDIFYTFPVDIGGVVRGSTVDYRDYKRDVTMLSHVASVPFPRADGSAWRR